MPHSNILVSFAQHAISRDGEAAARSRTALAEVAGQDAMIDAAAVIGGFDGITRIADATGIPLEDAKAAHTEDLRRQLKIDVFRTF